MAIWIVEGATLRPIKRFDNSVLLHPDHRDSHETQELFATLHSNKYWLLCSCKKPDARMFVRKLQDGRFALINHSEFGVHDEHCPLMTGVKGEAPERGDTPDARDGGTIAAKQTEYRLLAPFKQVDLLNVDGVAEQEIDLSGLDLGTDNEPEPAPNDPKVETASNPATKIDLLFRLMWQLLDDSFCAYRHYQQEITPVQMQMKLRAAAYQITLKGFGSLQDYCYTGQKGLDILFGQLNRAHKNKPKERHQYLFLCVITNYAQTAAGVSVILPDGSAMVLGSSKKPPLILNGMASGDGPFLLAAVYGYAKHIDDSPMIMKWALQPLADTKVLLPVASWSERLIALGMVRELDAIDASVNSRYKLWVHKPVLPIPDRMTGVWLQPVISLVGKDNNSERCRIAYRLSADVDNVDAYRRTFEHVHTLDLNTPDLLAKSCHDMFLVGKGVIEQHFLALDKEAEEHQHMAAGRAINQRMEAREQELLQNNDDADRK